MTAMTFEEAYANLNPEQKAAVDAIEGPVMVIAGPGTGKTQILTLRIANILARTDAPADAILALTFTEAAAANMRRRLVALIGSRGYYVNIHTFHGFANRLIQENPERFPAILGAENAADADQIGILRDILRAGEHRDLTPFGDPFHYVPGILGAIRKLKSEGWNPEKFGARLEEEQKEFARIPDLYHEKGAYKGKMKGEYRERLADLTRNRELAGIFEEYEKELRAGKLYDYEDMLIMAIAALEKDEDFLLSVQEKYQYLLVDEHQDTNGAQNRILELLASFHAEPNLFVVGDEKQAIFRFQGASLENFLYFKRKYPGVRLVNLARNYRSSQSILDSAQSLIEKNAATIKAPLTAVREKPPRPVEVVSFSLPEAELLFAAERIKEKLAEGTPPDQIAVLFRENREALPLADILEKQGVPFAIESDQDILKDEEMRKLLLLLESIEAFGADEKLAEVLHIDFLDVEPLDIYKLVESVSASRRMGRRESRLPAGRVSLYGLLARPERLMSLDLLRPEALTGLYAKLARWKKDSRNRNFLEFFERVVRESGFLAHLLTDLPRGGYEKTEKLMTLFGEIRKMVGSRGDYRLADFIKHLAILREHKVPIRAKFSRPMGAVRLMTAHRAKGLEFDAVIITGARDGVWGNRRNREAFALPFETSFDATGLERNEDERRLFYMALTRARDEVVVTYATRGADGREQVPSQFLGEISPELKTERAGTDTEERLLADRGLFFAPRRTAAPGPADAEFLSELFRTRGLHATGLNAYLKCPWVYFYNHLVRIPRAQSRFQVYGNSAHAALQDLFEKRRQGEPADEKFLTARFAEHLARYPLKTEDRTAILAQGQKVLPEYYAAREKEWNWNALTELKVNAILDDIPLKGNLDKVELLTDGEVAVVDYKTKAPRSRAWIEGKTKDSTGDYKRQLTFYKLLLDLYPERKFRMVRGTIDFIEPNDSGKFKQEAFEITDAETAELTDIVRRVADDIRNLKFWEKRCEDRECEYCALRQMMK